MLARVCCRHLRNRSAHPVVIRHGNYTPMFQTRPLHASARLCDVPPHGSSNEEGHQQHTPFSRWSVAVTLVAAVGLVGAGYAWVMNEKQKRFNKNANRTVGKAQVGGPFTLVDHNGIPRTELDFRGKFLLMYFGFTHCPDICPTELRKLSSVVSTIDKRLGPDVIQPVFITVDPMRDTVEQVREYITDFHPRIIGLTGTPSQVEKICRSYRVYYNKAKDPISQAQEDDYLVDHSIIIYLMDPNGDFMDFFGTNMKEQEVLARMEENIENFRHPDGLSLWETAKQQLQKVFS